jgi:membrane protein DedA with SNARE-associated domain
MSYLKPHEFAIFAYSGAFLWSGTFISLGYFLGDRWQATSERIHKYVLIGCAVAIALGLLYWGYRKWRERSAARRPG